MGECSVLIKHLHRRVTLRTLLILSQLLTQKKIRLNRNIFIFNRESPSDSCNEAGFFSEIFTSEFKNVDAFLFLAL